jgi:hypothetical protein
LNKEEEMHTRRLLLFMLLFLLPVIASGQFFDTGTDPGSLKWLQIKTGRFTIIYPESYGDGGLRFASSLDSSLDRLNALYPGIKVKIPVVLHNYTSFSNGYVAWAPRRIEMYPTPEMNTIPLDPVEQLTSHELAHVMQLYSLRQGFMKLLSLIGGEQVTGASSLFFPMWFMEGDAVLSESLLSASGRGRSASFQKEMKAIVSNGRLYSYDKMLFGSYRDFTPDHYKFGYQISAWSSSRYGHTVWNNALAASAKYPFLIDPVRFSLKKSTGSSQPGLYFQTFDSLRTIWDRDITAARPETYRHEEYLKEKEYRNYYCPVQIGTDSIVAIKTSISAQPAFVLLRPSKMSEKKIFIPGSMYPWFISGAAGKIVWVEDRPDARRENRTFSDIILLDVRRGVKTRLSHGGRYLAASVSPDGKFVAAVENTVSNRNSIVILDSRNGAVLRKIATPGNVFPQRPIWSEPAERITVIYLDMNGEGIMSLNTVSGKWTTDLPAAHDDLQSSFYRGDSLFWVSSASGTDNIWLQAPGGKRSMLTNSRFGVYDPSFSDGKLWFSEYTPGGYRIGHSDQTLTGSANNLKMSSSFLINRFDTVRFRTAGKVSGRYSPTPYRKWEHLFRFHSWMPFYANIEQLKTENMTVSPGLTLLSQNTLSTLTTSLGYEYTGGRHNFHSRVTWKGWLPVFESAIDYGAKPVVYKTDAGAASPSSLKTGLSFTNSVYLPLSFSSGRFSQYLYTSVSAKYQNNYIYDTLSKVYDYGQLQLRGRLYFSNWDVSAPRDIWPRWAQTVDLSYLFYPGDANIYGPMSSIRTEFYFPGLFRSHSLRLRYQQDYQDARIFVLYNIADLPRGWHNLVSLDYRLFSADYVLPLLYPDLSLPPVAYVKRIRGGLFYDHGYGKNNIYLQSPHNTEHKYFENFSSFGGELLADFYLFRLPLLFSGGVQAAWKDPSASPEFQLLFSVDIFGMKISREGNRK